MRKIIKHLVVNFIFTTAIFTVTNAQVTVPTNTIAAGDFVGSNNNINVEFRGNNTQYMLLLQSNGFLGIGTSFSPSFKLDIDAGDINLNSLNRAYMLGGVPVLWHNTNTSDIFVGVGAGNNSMTGHGNTYMGKDAGSSTTSGEWNTFIGWKSGDATTDGDNNTFVGWAAGQSTTSGYGNTYLGYKAGNAETGNVFSYYNTFVGGQAGSLAVASYQNTAVGYDALKHTQAYGGCALGFEACSSNTTGCGVIAIGEYSQKHNTTGGWNTSIGTAAMYTNTVFAHNVAIGAFALHDQNSLYTGASVNSFNVAVGNGSLNQTNSSNGTNGLHNTALGHESGLTNVTGGSNLFLGYKADAGSSALNNAGAIGANSVVMNSNELILGDNNVNVGIGLSGDATGPVWKLEINDGNADQSGLGFRQLRPASATGTAPYGKVLTVDITGEVVLVDDQGFGVTGYGRCPNSTLLGSNVGIRMVDFNMYHEGQNLDFPNRSVLNAIGIGYNCDDPLPAKLSVDQTYTAANVDFATQAGNFHNGDVGINLTNTFDKTGIFVNTDGVTTSTAMITNIGGDFLADNCNMRNLSVRGFAGNIPNHTTTEVSDGGHFEGHNGTKANRGVIALGDAHNNGLSSWGVDARALGGTQNNIAVSAISAGGGTGVNYGVFASAPIGPCLPGGCTNAAGYFNGDVWGINAYIASDQALKDNIEPLENAMDVINALQPKKYTFKTNQYPEINLPTGVQDGLIAQELESVLPELVKSFRVAPQVDNQGNTTLNGAADSYKAVNYIAIIPYLIQGMKEQQKTIEDLQTQINNCCNAGDRQLDPNDHEQSGNSMNVNLRNAQAIILNQNVPNPFAEQTSITYFITEEVKQAQIFFYDSKGTILKIVDIRERGEGQINVFAEDLSGGNYKYTLIADGNVIETKTMVKQ